MAPLATLCIVLSASMFLSGCGNPGALYLPDEQTAEGNQGSTEYVDPPDPAGFTGEDDEAFLGDGEGPAEDEAEEQEADNEEAEGQEKEFEQDRGNGTEP